MDLPCRLRPETYAPCNIRPILTKRLERAPCSYSHDNRYMRWTFQSREQTGLLQTAILQQTNVWFNARTEAFQTDLLCPSTETYFISHLSRESEACSPRCDISVSGEMPKSATISSVPLRSTTGR